jgi:hypothetical protein
MSSNNKFALLSQVNDKKRQIVITTDSNLPRKQKKAPVEKADKVEAPKMSTKETHAVAKQQAAIAVHKKTPAPNGKAAALVVDAPMSLKEAAAFNKKKAEEKAAKDAAAEVKNVGTERSAGEVVAVKGASEQAQAEVLAAVDAAKEAADEAADAKPKKAAEPAPEPPKPVMTLADYNNQRAENRFAIGSKQTRKVDKTSTTGFQTLTTHEDEIVVAKKAEAPKPVAKAPAPKGKAAAPAAAPKAEKKDKAQKIDLTQFADYSQERGRGGRGFGGRGRGAERGAGGERGGYRGGNDRAQAAPADRQPVAERQPNYDDARSFPSL